MLANPIFVYCSIWGLLLFLYSMMLSDFLLPLKNETIYLIFYSGLFLSLGWFTGKFLTYGFRFKFKYIDDDEYREMFGCKVLNRRLIISVKIWFLLTVLEVIYYGNLPFLSLLGIGSGLEYTDFGFPGVHGFLNSLYFVIVLYMVGRIYYVKSSKDIFILFFLLLWPLMVVHRMMIVAVLVQSFFLIYILAFKNIGKKFYFRSSLFLLILVLTFGYIGDFRTGRESILQLAGFNDDYPDWLPSAFAWTYLYMTTPIGNINFNILNFSEPILFPINTFANFIPSFARGFVLDFFGKDNFFELVVDSFNVGTLFLPLLQDFGFYLAPFIFYILGFVICFMVLRSYNNPRYILFWVVFLYAIVASVFANQMFSLVFLSEALFGYFLFKKPLKIPLISEPTHRS